MFDYMLSDLTKVVRNSQHPLTEASFSPENSLHFHTLIFLGSSQGLHGPVVKGSGIPAQPLNHAQSMHFLIMGVYNVVRNCRT